MTAQFPDTSMKCGGVKLVINTCLYFPHWYTTDIICHEQREEEHVYTAHLQISTSYIQCKKDVAYVKPCSEGTMWDDKKQTCDHPTENNSCMKILGKYIILLGVLVLNIRNVLVLCVYELLCLKLLCIAGVNAIWFPSNGNECCFIR